ncbi:cell wall hydrolase [Acetobacter sicerae]|uniref:cell wall hydrolase n=1 Tax=Acetobacter sicerae TaxID=85325 RepID=UPI00156AFF9A|nr:cell wall hydrolase [Acetobacter sicerae]NHN93811.1 cell wall hydrolase [Acetobacter sicerae]
MTPTEIAARTAWGEARGDGPDGMHAVLNVIGNRVKQPSWWGHDIAGVCQRPWQFSCWNSDDPNRAKLLAVTEQNAQFAIALKLAGFLVAGTLSDITHGADHYYSVHITPPLWANCQKPTAHIGDQLFFRLGPYGRAAGEVLA